MVICMYIEGIKGNTGIWNNNIIPHFARNTLANCVNQCYHISQAEKRTVSMS